MTSPLGTDLQHLGNSSDARRLPPPATVRRAGDRRRRRRTTLGLAAAAALASSAVAVALTTLGPSDQLTQPTGPLPRPNTTPQPAPTDRGSPLHPINPAGHRFDAHAIAAHDGRYVVVGDSSDLTDAGPAVFWSGNGIDWQAPPMDDRPDSVNVTDVIAGPGGFLAVGVGRGGRAAAWHAADGRAWAESPVIAARNGGAGGLWGISETRFGYYAWGFNGGPAHLWRSEDGTSWAPVVDESVFNLPQRETICAVLSAGEGLRATGVVAPPGTREGRRVAWTSENGETWARADASGAPTFWCDSPRELGHLEARGNAGLVRIHPDDVGSSAELVPSAP